MNHRWVLSLRRKPACAHDFFCQKDSCWVGKLWGAESFSRCHVGTYCAQAGGPGGVQGGLRGLSISRVLGGHQVAAGDLSRDRRLTPFLRQHILGCLVSE